MNRKMIFLQGLVLITITMIANVLLTNWIISKRTEEIKTKQNSLIRSVDHIFTALTYMERNTGKELNDKINFQLEAARKTLRSPELMNIRRELSK